MKPAILILTIAFLTFVSSCNSGDKEKNEPTEVVTADTVYDYSDSFDTDSLLHVKNETLLWHADDSNGLRMRKPVEVGIDTMSVQTIIPVSYTHLTLPTKRIV